MKLICSGDEVENVKCLSTEGRPDGWTDDWWSIGDQKSSLELSPQASYQYIFTNTVLVVAKDPRV